MSKRSELPGSEALFGKKAGGKGKDAAKALQHSDVTALKHHDAEALQENTERMTLYMTPELWDAIENTKRTLYREHGIKAKKSQIVCLVLERHVGDVGDIAKSLTGKKP